MIERFVPHDPATCVQRAKEMAEFLKHAKRVVRKLRIQQLFRSRRLDAPDEWEKTEGQEEEEEEERKRKTMAQIAAADEEEEEGEEEEEEEEDIFFEYSKEGNERMDHIDFAPILEKLPLIESLDICYRWLGLIDRLID